jgi:hypothetical protein
MFITDHLHIIIPGVLLPLMLIGIIVTIGCLLCCKKTSKWKVQDIVKKKPGNVTTVNVKPFDDVNNLPSTPNRRENLFIGQCKLFLVCSFISIVGGGEEKS